MDYPILEPPQGKNVNFVISSSFNDFYIHFGQFQVFVKKKDFTPVNILAQTVVRPSLLPRISPTDLPTDPHPAYIPPHRYPLGTASHPPLPSPHSPLPRISSSATVSEIPYLALPSHLPVTQNPNLVPRHRALDTASHPPLQSPHFSESESRPPPPSSGSRILLSSTVSSNTLVLRPHT